MSVRLDKWLQVARIFKTRTQAARACSSGRVRVNGSVAKPHRPASIDDRIEIKFGDWTRIIRVADLRDRPVPKAIARELYEDFSPPRPRLDPVERILRGGVEQRDRGRGRPTKRERRQIDRLKTG